jgi:hypothetical protein
MCERIKAEDPYEPGEPIDWDAVWDSLVAFLTSQADRYPALLNENHKPPNLWRHVLAGGGTV